MLTKREALPIMRGLPAISDTSILFSEHGRGEVSLACVWQQYYNRLALVLLALCKLDCSPQSRTRGYPDKNALRAGNAPACFKRVLVLNRDYLVVNLGVERVRNEARADTLNFVRACVTLGEDGGAFRLYRNHLYGGLALLKRLARTRNSAARANARDKNIDLALGVPPPGNGVELLERFGVNKPSAHLGIFGNLVKRGGLS